MAGSLAALVTSGTRHRTGPGGQGCSGPAAVERVAPGSMVSSPATHDLARMGRTL